MQTSAIWLEWYLKGECVFSSVQRDTCLKALGVDCLKCPSSSKLCCQSNFNLIWSDHSRAQAFREVCCSPNVTALITWKMLLNVRHVCGRWACVRLIYHDSFKVEGTCCSIFCESLLVYPWKHSLNVVLFLLQHCADLTMKLLRYSRVAPDTSLSLFDDYQMALTLKSSNNPLQLHACIIMLGYITSLLSFHLMRWFHIAHLIL